MGKFTERPRSRNRRLSPAVVVAVVLGLAGPVVLGTAGEAVAATCPCSIRAPTDTPAAPSDSDTAAVEVGMKFRADVAGQITAIRFYKGSANTGTHVGHLWDATGTPLAIATFTSESASGWQQVNLTSPVTVAANNTYVASYYAPNGRYAADDDFFATTGVDNTPLHALRDGVDGGNGVYRYGAGGGSRPAPSDRPTTGWTSSSSRPGPTRPRPP